MSHNIASHASYHTNTASHVSCYSESYHILWRVSYSKSRLTYYSESCLALHRVMSHTIASLVEYHRASHVSNVIASHVSYYGESCLII